MALVLLLYADTQICFHFFANTSYNSHNLPTLAQCGLMLFFLFICSLLIYSSACLFLCLSLFCNSDSQANSFSARFSDENLKKNKRAVGNLSTSHTQCINLRNPSPKKIKIREEKYGRERMKNQQKYLR